MFWPSSASVASIARIFSGTSSTTSMLTGSLVFILSDPCRFDVAASMPCYHVNGESKLGARPASVLD